MHHLKQQMTLILLLYDDAVDPTQAGDVVDPTHRYFVILLYPSVGSYTEV